MGDVNFPSLRRVAERDLTARNSMTLWSLRNGELAGSMVYAPLPHSPFLVAVTAHRKNLGWCGYVNLEEWLEYTAPELARLASRLDVLSPDPSPVSREKMIRLFDSSEFPLEMPIPELAYDILEIHDISSLPRVEERLLSINTPQGRVWLKDYPHPVPSGSRGVSAHHVPLPIVLCLGSSDASWYLLKTMRRGDVLLMRQEQFVLVCMNKVIGRFSINEDGEISVQVASQYESETQEGHWEQSDASVVRELADIPLRLNFILQRRMMTLAQLDALYQGQVLQFDPLAERQIDVVVNGARIAKGELVELNGCLGVELHEISVSQLSAEK